MNVVSVPLADTHCHLMLSDFDDDRMQVLERARSAGVNRMLVPGLDLATSRRAVELAEQFKEIYAAVGVHPHYASNWDHSTEIELRLLIDSPKVVAVGEIGLDYYRNISPPETQKRAFHAQLNLACACELPVVIHNREAVTDVMDHLLDWSTALPPRLVGRAGVLHANSTDLETAGKAISAGFYIGIAGPVTYRNAGSIRQIIAQLPLERQLIETDAPYLTPNPHRGKRNEPAYVKFVAKEIAKLMDISQSKTTEVTSRNAANLFGWTYENNNHVL